MKISFNILLRYEFFIRFLHEISFASRPLLLIGYFINKVLRFIPKGVIVLTIRVRDIILKINVNDLKGEDRLTCTLYLNFLSTKIGNKLCV